MSNQASEAGKSGSFWRKKVHPAIGWPIFVLALGIAVAVGFFVISAALRSAGLSW